jgi:hypothetical protein
MAPPVCVHLTRPGASATIGGVVMLSDLLHWMVGWGR